MHLLVCHHGLWGNAEHLQFLTNAISQRQPDLKLLCCNSNRGINTLDGIDVCGDRIVRDILELLQSEPSITEISFLGYSLGGLICRYAIGKLFAHGTFSSVQPRLFVTMATPHLGSELPKVSMWKPHVAFFNRAFNTLTRTFTSRTGHQLTLRDQYHDGLPLLIMMADHDSCFIQGLQLFARRACFVNVQNDPTVRFTTGSIEHSNPYRKRPAEVIDPQYPSIVRIVPSEDAVLVSRPFNPTDIPKYGMFILLAPVFITIALTALSSYALYHRANRISGIDVENEWFKEFKQKALTESCKDVLDSTTTGEAESHQHISALLTQESTNIRHWMVDNLNRLGWEKVHVRLEQRRAHAGIVVRRASDKTTDQVSYLVDKYFTDLDFVSTAKK
ncbi:putative serine esterase-domain-containing protein [Polychytrium aggregatum]|uniref:putative serine esterase-domain-containing protein n=1 Tax=Polychytrium aggregatum TaxID=110093 RepID=UPI0022FE96CB|nr:putative serine esterase-domain-containing protein [Polychytrium aggregatum]KAI9193557.1 putative serine esterase-domain-containing protein [Polychytrium aggregatum]